MAGSKFTFHRLLNLPLLRWVKTIATWKTVIESMQFLGMDNFRVAFNRFLAFYSDSPSGLRDGETCLTLPFRYREVQKDCQNRKREIGYMLLENCPFLKTAYFQSLFSMWLWF